MKFVSDIKNIKLDYLYEIRDYQINDIIIIKEITSFKKITYLNLSRNASRFLSIETNNISGIPETSLLFINDTCYAFYEIGHKDQYPEYLL